MVGQLLVFLQLEAVQIKLSTTPKTPTSHYMCMVDEVRFMVPRRIVESGEEFILKVPVKKQIDGVWKTYTVQLGLPWQRNLCEEMDDTEWRQTQSP